MSSPVDRDALSRGHEMPRLAYAEGGQATARAELGTRQPKSGTDGSNPVPSSGESCKPDQPANPARLRPRELRTCDQAMATVSPSRAIASLSILRVPVRLTLIFQSKRFDTGLQHRAAYSRGFQLSGRVADHAVPSRASEVP